MAKFSRHDPRNKKSNKHKVQSKSDWEKRMKEEQRKRRHTPKDYLDLADFLIHGATPTD